MGAYKYKAQDSNGQIIEGVMTAASENSVAMKLEQQGLVPLFVSVEGRPLLPVDFLARFNRVSPAELNIFTRQLYTLQKAGIPLLSGLAALLEQTSTLAMKDVINQLMKDIEAGGSFSAAIKKHPKVFNDLYASMIESGEVSGKLVEILDRLSQIGVQEEKTRRRITSALRYPVMVVVGIVIGFLVLVSAVVPRFAKLYSDFGSELPLPTKILLSIQYMISHFWWLVLILGAGGVFFIQKLVNTASGRYQLDNLKLKIPVFGPLLKQIIMSRFSRLTSMLMRSGIPLLKIFDLLSRSVGNVIISQTMDNIKISINAGKSMHIPMKASGLFPPLVVQMVSVGESTGKVDELLLHVADYYDEQVDYMIGNLISLIEPILIVFLGGVVLFMALGIFLPMWNLMSLFK